METFECMFKRRSVRKYLESPVEWNKIGYVLEAGRAAPSSGNLQNWRFIVCTSADQRKSLAEACLQQSWMEKAPVHIVITSEAKKVEIFYGIRGERLYAVQNCAAAIQNMLLAATAQGLGSCWVGAFDEEMIKRICGIPGQSRPQAVITIGYPAQKVKDPGRTALYTVVYVAGYGGRIYDINKVFGFHSAKVKALVNTSKEVMDNSSSKLNELISKGKSMIKKNLPKK